jgi:membrane-associated protease RseP (regulator of RpoE activity)
MDSVFAITPLFIVATLGFVSWGYWRAWQRGKASLLAWTQGLLLLFPWILFLGLLTAGVYLTISSFIFLVLLFSGGYIALGSWTRQERAKEVESRRLQGNNEVFLSPEIQIETTPPESAVSDPIPSDPTLSPLTPEIIKAIESIFGIDTFFATGSIPYGEGIIFQGNLRLDPERALEKLSERLKNVVGDRYQLYLVEDREEKASVVVLPTHIVQQRSSLGAKALAAGILLASFLTTLEVGANLLNFRLWDHPERWWEALPIAVGILSILVIHEAGHRWVAGRYGVRLSPAFVIPTLGIGTLGSLNRIESPLPNRQALFDIALAGPAWGGLISLVVLGVGFVLSQQADAALIYIPEGIFRSSILVGGLARLFLEIRPDIEFIGIHPLVVIGWISLGITALSLLPAGQLDGGRIVQAVYGRKVAGRATVITLIALGFSALTNALSLYWALVVLFIARDPERPPINELTETDGIREVLALVALFLMAMTLLPMAPPVAHLFNFS